MIKFFKEIYLRLKIVSPPFFKKLTIFGGSLSAAGLTFLAVDSLKEIGTYMITAGTVIAGVSQLTAVTPPTKTEINK